MNYRIFLLALPFAIIGCNKPVTQQEVIRPVQAQRISFESAQDKQVYSGEIKARREADLSFRVNGKIIARSVEIGSKVNKGQVLAQLDPIDAQLAVENARAQVAAAETDYNYAQAELHRYKNLLDKNFISQTSFDQKQNAYNSSKARADSARALLAVNRNQAGYTSLISDTEGVITAINGEVGQVVAAGQAVMKLARTEEKEVLINVPENRLAEFKQGLQVAVRLWAGTGKIYPGKVREISPNADPTTRTFTAKISVIEPGPEVQLGMTANVLTGGNEGRFIVKLPLSALLQQGDRPAVWVVDPRSNKVALRSVEIAQYREDGVVIATGLQADEIVITAGVHKLLPDQTVRLPESVTQLNTRQSSQQIASQR